MAINYSLTLRGNPSDPTAAKRVYANAQAKQVLDINDFADHIISHGSVYSKGDLVGILTMAVSCIKEQLLSGNSVQLGELGKFYISLSSQGARTFDEFTAQNIKKVSAKWTPSQELKDLRSKAEFERVLTKKDEAEAKKTSYGK